MNPFLQNHANDITGQLTGMDRIRFHGTIRKIGYAAGMLKIMNVASILLMKFAEVMQGFTEGIRSAAKALADKADRPVIYLPSCHTSKEAVALKVAEERQITEGLICVITCVESCNTFTIHRNRAAKQLELKPHVGRCLFQYFYVFDSVFGFMHVRVQTHAPFNIHVCLNGRDWLERLLIGNGIGYHKRDNCFVHIDDIEAAQALANSQLDTNWCVVLDRLQQQFHPTHGALFGNVALPYYWSVVQSEYAHDIMFRSPEALMAIYPSLARHALLNMGSKDSLRFLGHRPVILNNSTAEITTHYATRPEGVCVKHRVNGNTIKMYDKQESVLRIETTINNTVQIKLDRTNEDGERVRLPMRKAVADLKPRMEISHNSNERYLCALASIFNEEALGTIIADICQPKRENGRQIRAIAPLAEADIKLLTAVNDGGYVTVGFRNCDICTKLYGERPKDKREAKRLANRVTRQFRILRAHKLIQKVPKTHRYQVTEKGRRNITAILAALQANTKKLGEIAA